LILLKRNKKERASMLRIRFLLDIAFPALVMCLTGILVWGATASDTGYRALSQLQDEAEVKTAELDALRARRLELEQRADLLNPKSLDPDILDERIRAVLGYSREGDVVIPRRELDRLLSEEKR
jgi:cell division protein FtsB